MQQKLVEPLSPWFNVVWIKVCSSHGGFPSRRTRSLTFSNVRDRLHWVGPTDPQEVQRDFDSFFSRQLMLDGDIYLQASVEEVEEVYKKMLEKRQQYFDHESDISVYGKGILSSMLGPGQMSRLGAFADIYKEKSQKPFLADCDHWPGSPGDTSGPLFPVQLKHGCIYSFAKRRLAIASEHLAAQGWHVLGIHSGSRFVSPVLPMLKELSTSQVKTLSGNGMSLPCIAAWFLYCFSNTIRVESAKLLEEHAVAACNDDDDEALFG